MMHRQPVIYTFGYSGWGPNVKKMKSIFNKHNQAIRGRNLRWIDVRYNRSVRAPGFNGSKIEKMLGSDNYLWIKNLGNKYASNNKNIKLLNPIKGYDELYKAVKDAEQNNLDLMIFCHCPYFHIDIYEINKNLYCHRKLIVDNAPTKLIKYFPSKRGQEDFHEWPPLIDSNDIDLFSLYPTKRFKCTESTLYLPENLKMPNYSSPYVIPYGIRIRFRDVYGMHRSVRVWTVLPSKNNLAKVTYDNTDYFISHGLVIKEKPLNMILSGEKIWEIRGTNTNKRERIALIKSGSGYIFGTAEIVGSIGPLSKSDFNQNTGRHGNGRVNTSDFREIYGGKPYAWVLANIKQYFKPVAYRHPRGAINWIELSKSVQSKLN
jgi:hypothetical protein